MNVCCSAAAELSRIEDCLELKTAKRTDLIVALSTWSDIYLKGSAHVLPSLEEGILSALYL